MAKYPFTKNCEKCTNPFIISRAYNRHQKYCSKTCYATSQRTRLKFKAACCIECNNNIADEIYQTQFCSRSCAAIYHNRQRSARTTLAKQHKVSFTISRSQIHKLLQKQNPKPKKSKPTYIRLCASCQQPCYDNKKKYCSSCYPNIRHYRSLTAFKFNVYDYPENFDLQLVATHGWFSPNGYKSRNKKPNLAGVSRDHLFTVADGFKLRVDPKLLSHPANCAIVPHNGPNGNNSKRKSSITLDQLIARINSWDSKYKK